MLRHKGVIYAVVPDRRYTFDHLRALTPPEHLWADYEGGTNQSDGSHSDEFVDHVDWNLFRPDLSADQVPDAREFLREQYHIAAQGGEINIHFHVFEASNLRDFVELAARRLHLRWTIVELREHFPDDCPNGILVVIQVRKRRWYDWRSLFSAPGKTRNRLSAVRPDARPIAAADEMRRRY